MKLGGSKRRSSTRAVKNAWTGGIVPGFNNDKRPRRRPKTGPRTPLRSVKTSLKRHFGRLI